MRRYDSDNILALIFDVREQTESRPDLYESDTARLYTAACIAEEAGEVCGEIKKAMRADRPVNDYKLLLELGDVLWYVAAMAEIMGVSLDDVAAANQAKLRARRAEKAAEGKVTL